MYFALFFEQGSEVDQKDDDAAAGNLWRKKLVLHGMRVVDNFVGYRDNPIHSRRRERTWVSSVQACRRRLRPRGLLLNCRDVIYLGSLLDYFVYKPVMYGARRSEGIYSSEEPAVVRPRLSHLISS
jgi:hypothetical protein